MKTIILLIVFSLSLIACNQNPKSNDKSTPDSKKENGLSVAEEGIKRQNSVANASNDSIKTYAIDKELVKKTFLQFLPSISGGRKLNAADKWDGYEITLADINGDNLIDAVVYYSLEPTMDDAGGGNAILYLPGLVAYINTGKNLIMADHTDDFYAEGLTKIINGVIFLEGHDYANDDPRCCPSIKTTTKIILRNNKLTLLK